jgi:hypothetical protein
MNDYEAPADTELDNGRNYAIINREVTVRPVFQILDDDGLHSPASWSPKKGWYSRYDLRG